MTLTAEVALEALRGVMDPELQRDLVSLNMVRDIEVEDGAVSLTVVLTTPACPLRDPRQRRIGAPSDAPSVPPNAPMRRTPFNATNGTCTTAGGLNITTKAATSYGGSLGVKIPVN